jgi:lia operon protein LiaI
MLQVGFKKNDFSYNKDRSKKEEHEMKKPGKIVGGILLIFIGASILLGMLGINIGGLIGLIIGGCFLYWGYSKFKEKGKWSFSSLLLVALGAVILLGGIGGVVSLLIGALLVYGGYKLMQGNDEKKEDMQEEEMSKTVTKQSTYDTIDEEFTRLIGEGGKPNGYDKN